MTGSDATRPTDAQEAERLIGDARTLCEQLLAITREQDAMIERGESEALVELIQRREELVAGVERAGASIRALGLDRPGVLARLEPAARARIESGLRSLRELGAAIGEADRRAERAMVERRDALGRELHGVRGGGRAVRAYAGGAGVPSAKYEDRRG